MKNILIAFTLLLSITIVSCDKENSGDNYLKGTFVAPYLAFDANQIEATQGANSVVPLTIATAFQQDLTVTYSISGAFTKGNTTITIPRNELGAEIEVVVPPNLITIPGDTVYANVTLISGVLKDGTILRVGKQGDTANETAVIAISEE